MPEVLVFGQFGKAVYRQKEDLFLFDLKLGEPEKIREGDAAFLFDTGGEIRPKTYPKLDLSVLRKDLEVFSLGHDALEMAFDCFNPDFDEETLFACAEAAEELLADEASFAFVTNRMLARPLPEKVDLDFPKKLIAENQFSHLSRLLQLVLDCQQATATVLTTWEEVANQFFTDIQLAYKVQNTFVEEGVFSFAVQAAHSKDRNRLGLLPTEFIDKPNLKFISSLQRILTELHGRIKKSMPEDQLPDLVPEEKYVKSSSKKPTKPNRRVSVDFAEIDKLKDATVQLFTQGNIAQGDIKLKELCKYQISGPGYLAMSLSDVAHRIYHRRDLFDKAVEIYGLAVRKNKVDPVPWCGLGTIYKSRRKYGTALKMYKKAQYLDPYNVVVWNGMAEVYKSMHEYDTALEKYEKAQSLDPSYVVAWNGMAEVYKAMDRFEDAEKCYLHAKEKLTQDPYTYCGLGFLWLKKKPDEKLTECGHLFEEALKIDSSNLIALLGQEVINRLRNKSIKKLADQEWFERTMAFLSKDENEESIKHATVLKNLETANLSDPIIRRETLEKLADTGSYLLQEMAL